MRPHVGGLLLFAHAHAHETCMHVLPTTYSVRVTLIYNLQLAVISRLVYLELPVIFYLYVVDIYIQLLYQF